MCCADTCMLCCVAVDHARLPLPGSSCPPRPCLLAQLGCHRGAAAHAAARARGPRRLGEGGCQARPGYARLHALGRSGVTAPCLGPCPQVNDLVLAGDVLVSCSNDRTLRVWQPDSPGALCSSRRAPVPAALALPAAAWGKGLVAARLWALAVLPTAAAAPATARRSGAGLPHRPLRLCHWAGGLGRQQHAGQRRPARRGAAVGPGGAAPHHDGRGTGE